MNARGLLHMFLRRLASSPTAREGARRLGNLSRLVVGYHLSGLAVHIDLSQNGEAWLARTCAPGARRFVDVGANIGEWAEVFLAAAPPSVEGLLIDASSSAVARLRERFGATPGLEVLQAAVADATSPATMSFYEEPEAGQTSSLVAAAAGVGARRQEVPVVSLDAALALRGWDTLDFLKIDTEGFDLHVLRGARGLLMRQAVAVVQFEYNSPWRTVGSTLGEALALLTGAGYTVCLLTPDGLWHFDYSRWGEFYAYSNFVAFSPDALARLKTPLRGTI